MKHLKIFITTTALILPFISCQNKVEQKDDETVDNVKPNVLLLYMDDLRPELGSYGASHIHSPNIDAFANRSVKFNEAYCNVAVSGASRASMLTGIRPTKNIYKDYKTWTQEDSPDAISLPLLFKNNGYTTISNGKIYHHLDDNTSDWDEVWRPYAFDKNDKGLKPTDYWQSLWKDYQRPENISEYKATDKGPAFESADVHDSTYIDGLMTQKVIRDLKKLKNSDKPFFLTAGFISPHLPFNAPAKYWDLYDKDSIKQPYNNFIPKNAPKVSISNWGEMRAYTNIPKKGQVSDSIAKLLIHGYYATASYTDALTGKILNALKELEMDKNTIVVLVADHGYNLQEHTQWCKFTSHRTSMRVPLIIYTPDMTEGGNTDALTELVDIYPTLAELCGIQIPENQIEGKSLIPILNNPETKGKEHAFIKNGNGYTIKTPKFSYTEFINADNETFTSMLHDHKKDIDENENVVDYPEYAEVVEQLKKILHTEYQANIIGDRN